MIDEDSCFLCMSQISSTFVAASKDQEELADQMDEIPNDQIYVGQKCQDMTEEKEEADPRALLKENSFKEKALKENKEGCRNPFSNIPFSSSRSKEQTKVAG